MDSRRNCSTQDWKTAWSHPLSHSTASDRWQTTGNVQEPRRPGHTRSTTRQQDQFVVLSSLRDRTAPTRALQNELMNATNITICDQNILNRLREAGLRSRSAAVRSSPPPFDSGLSVTSETICSLSPTVDKEPLGTGPLH